MSGIRDLDGEPVVPQYICIHEADPRHGGTAHPSFSIEYVPAKYVVVLHAKTAMKLPRTVISRIAVKVKDVEEGRSLARLAVLDWDNVEAFYTHLGKVYRVRIGERKVVGGLNSLTIPLAIATMNIGLAALSDVYERKREALIMSCVGFNPMHISSIFICEALVIGAISGTLGFVLGINSYRLITLPQFRLGVRQKIEPEWGITALVLSILASMVGSLIPAIKASMLATPSLIRRWKLDSSILKRKRGNGENYFIEIPLEVTKENVVDFLLYLSGHLRRCGRPYISSEWFEDVHITGHEPPKINLYFVHKWSGGRVHTVNRLLPAKSGPRHYVFHLESTTFRQVPKESSMRQIQKTVSVLRRLILRYSHDYRYKMISERQIGRFHIERVKV
ncbi:ABC transporter permease [Candidatus Bathyarchaeota archaeon]|nr:MAG: ABC transporter permease [Candidatus Bathyarchaeota archaeon]